jgi:hypothetical protein
VEGARQSGLVVGRFVARNESEGTRREDLCNKGLSSYVNHTYV